jgi:chemotaxis protein CheZ
MAERGDSGQAAFSARLAAIRDQYPGTDPEMVAEVVRAVLSSMNTERAAKEKSLLGEVEALGRIISAAKAELAALRVDDITASDIPSATDELDAIIEHTASATHAILASCETLDAVAEKLEGELAARLQDATTRVYEACSFQDITGQRITKVVKTLKAIEAKIAQLVQTFGEHSPASAVTQAQQESHPEDLLLNGPQLPTLAMDQSGIDKLLASFD